LKERARQTEERSKELKGVLRERGAGEDRLESRVSVFMCATLEVSPKSREGVELGAKRVTPRTHDVSLVDGEQSESPARGQFRNRLCQ
jgi:hypothetical protein